MATKGNSKYCSHLRWRFFVVLLPAADVNLESCKTSKMEFFIKNSQKLKAPTIFAKTFTLDFEQGSEYASKLAFKCKSRMSHF